MGLCLCCSRSKRCVLAGTNALPHGPLPPGRTTPDGAPSGTFETHDISCGRVRRGHHLRERPWPEGQGQIARKRGRGDGWAPWIARERAWRCGAGGAEAGAWPGGASQGEIGGRELGVQVSRRSVFGASTSTRRGSRGNGGEADQSRSIRTSFTRLWSY
jgi:hypothetical protein